jgi:uncharacterized protein (TIGR00369 family)
MLPTARCRRCTPPIEEPTLSEQSLSETDRALMPGLTALTAPDGPHVWTTLGFRLTAAEPGRASVAWEATAAYGFVTGSGPVIQGGLVTAILDAGMGAASRTLLGEDETFLTADLRVEFHRPSRPGLLVAHGTVERRTRRAYFCSAELTDTAGTVLAVSRCTNLVLPAQP